MLRHAIVQERAIRACGKAWQQGCNRSLDVANDPQLHRMTAAEVGRLDVDLNDASFFGVELLPREIAAQHKQGVAAHQCAVARGDAEDTGHADVEGIVVLEEVLGTRRVGDGRLQPVGQGDDLVMGAVAARATIDRDLRAGTEHLRDAIEFGVARLHYRRRPVHGERWVVGDLRLGNVDRQDQHCDAALRQGGLRRHRCLAPRLARRADLAAENTASPVDRREIHLLRKVEALLIVGDLTSDEHDGRSVPVRFEQPIDEMQAPRSAGTGTGREIPAQQRLRAGRKATDFLVTHVHPFDLAAPDGVGDVVQRVARDTPAMPDTGRLQCLDNDLGNGLLAHNRVLSSFGASGRFRD